MAIPESIVSASAERNFLYVARRSSGAAPRMPSLIFFAKGPDTLTTPTPDFPAPLATAMIVSTLSMGWFLAPLYRSSNGPLLRDGQYVVY